MEAKNLFKGGNPNEDDTNIIDAHVFWSCIALCQHSICSINQHSSTSINIFLS